MVKKKQWMAFMLSFALLCSMMPASEVAAAKKISLNIKKLTILTGKSKTLRVKNTTKKVTWKILSGKKYITLKKKGKMTATVKGRKKGTAKVQAKVGKKKLICRVIVNNKKKSTVTQEPNHTAIPLPSGYIEPTPPSVSETTEPPASTQIPSTNPPTATEQPLDVSNMEWDELVKRELVDVRETQLLKCKTNITGTLNIGSNITNIGSQAFVGCSSLTEIRIPASVSEIEWEQVYDSIMPAAGAFYGCSSLNKIVVDSENTVYDSRDNCNAIIKTSSNCLVAGCRKTVIPNSVLRIGNKAFNGCDTLTGITIPEGVDSIEWNAFDGCSSLTELTIPASVKKIQSDFAFGAFLNCGSLTTIKVDPNNTVYDSRDDCNAIIQTESNVLICGCQNTVIPPDITRIESGAFDGRSSLTGIAIPNSVTTIGGWAFGDCSNLTEIVIPASVTEIWTGSAGSFDGCNALSKIEVDPNNTVYDSRNDCNAIIRTSDNRLVQGCKNTVIPASVAIIGYGAFYNCNSLVEISIPNGVTQIEGDAFWGCSGLAEISIPNSVTQIGMGAFWGCSSLKRIIIPNSVTDINNYAFYGCSNLMEIVVPSSVTFIGPEAFFGVKKVIYSGTASGSPWGAQMVVSQ